MMDGFSWMVIASSTEYNPHAHTRTTLHNEYTKNNQHKCTLHGILLSDSRVGRRYWVSLHVNIPVLFCMPFLPTKLLKYNARSFISTVFDPRCSANWQEPSVTSIMKSFAIRRIIYLINTSHSLLPSPHPKKATHLDRWFSEVGEFWNYHSMRSTPPKSTHHCWNERE